MATTTDELKIRVHVDKGNTTKDLGSVISALKLLNKEAASKSVKGLAKSLDSLATASKGLGKLPRAVAAIEGIKISPKLKENLDKIAEAGKALSATGRGIKAAADGFEKISKMGSDTDLDKKFDNVSNAVSRFVENLNSGISDETISRLEKVADTLDRITQNANTKIKGKIVDVSSAVGAPKAAKAAITWGSLEKVFSKISSSASDIARNLYGVFEATGITKDIDRITSAVQRNIPVLGELTDSWKVAASEIKNILLSQSSLVDKAANLMLVRVKHITKALYSLAKIPFTNIGMTKGIMALLSMPFRGFAENIKDLTKRWNKFTSSLARIAVYRLIRTALKEIAAGIREGVDNLYLWAQAWKDTYKSADRFLQSMDTLTTGFLYLKNSIGAAVSPLIDYVAPIIDSLIDKFVSLANAINQALAALTGASLWRKAVRYPVTYGDTMANAKKKADDLKRTVLAFDELNKLDDNKKKSGGSGSDEWDQSKMFEEMAVGDKFRKLLNSADWTPIGRIISDKINNALKNIDWHDIKVTTTKWATRFGTLFNSVLNGVSMPLIGKSFAELGNTIALGINTFFDKIDFKEFGEHLAKGLEMFIFKAKWGEWGKALTQKIKALIDTLYGFRNVDLSGLGAGITEMIAGMFENIDFGRIADAVSTLAPKIGTEIGVVLNGLFTNTNRALGGVDFKKLGSKFAEAINNLFSQIDPKEAGVFLTNGLKAVLEAVSGAAETLDWDKLTETIGGVISSMFENIDLSKAVQSAMTIAEKLVGILNAVVENIPWGDVGTALSKADTTKLRDGIKKLFSNLVNGLKNAGVLDEISGGIAAFIGLKLGGAFLKILPSLMPALASGLGAEAPAALAGALGSAFSGGAAVAIGAALGQQLSHHVIGPILEAFGSADAELYKTWTFFGDDGLFQAGIDFAAMKVDDFKKNLSNFVATHKNLWENMTNGTTVMGESFHWLHGVITGDSSEVETSINNLKSRFTAIKDSWASEHPIITAGFEAIKKAADEKMGPVKTLLEDAGNFLKDTFFPNWDETWDSVSTVFSDAWEGMKKFAKDAINAIIGFINGLLSGAGSGLNGFISAVTSLSGSSIAGKTLSITLPQINIPQIPYLAGGGLVGQGSMFVAGEAGPELVTSWGNDSAVLNVDQIVDAIAQGVAMASGGDITIPVYLDGNILDNVIVTAQQRQNIRSGGR